MKAKIISFTGYNYISKKDGLQREGKNIGVITSDPINESDGKGNFTIGHTYEEIYIPPTLGLDDSDIEAMIGNDVELIYERRPGQKYERLVDIRMI